MDKESRTKATRQQLEKDNDWLCEKNVALNLDNTNMVLAMKQLQVNLKAAQDASTRDVLALRKANEEIAMLRKTLEVLMREIYKPGGYQL